MLRKLILITVFFSFALPVSAGQFKVPGVYDGDSLKATGHDIDIKVRLVGIDAPEIKWRKHKPVNFRDTPKIIRFYSSISECP